MEEAAYLLLAMLLAVDEQWRGCWWEREQPWNPPECPMDIGRVDNGRVDSIGAAVVQMPGHASFARDKRDWQRLSKRRPVEVVSVCSSKPPHLVNLAPRSCHVHAHVRGNVGCRSLRDTLYPIGSKVMITTGSQRWFALVRLG